MKKLLLILFGSVLIFSCAKEDGRTNQVKIEKRSTVTNDYSIFGNNYYVTKEIAELIAVNINYFVPSNMKNGNGLREVESSMTIKDTLGNEYIHVFNYADDGYIMISADERHEPIISMVKKGKYESQDVPSGLYNWLVVTLEALDAAKNDAIDNRIQSKLNWLKLIHDINNPDLISMMVNKDCCEDCPEWPDCLEPDVLCGDPYACNEGDPCGDWNTLSSGPLMTTEWNQSCGGFNNLCDLEECNGNNLDCPDNCNDNPPTGGVATAMGQILKYWAHPSSQGYNYASMPNSNGNSEVQRLMVDVGCSVDMDYDCDGSGASQNKIPRAFKNDFEYSTSELDDWGTNSLNQVISDISQSKPVILVGYSKRKKHKFIINWWTSYSEGHAWDCDGYWKTYNNCYSTTKLHMNWGWWGRHNGWYHYNTWDPPNQFNFQYSREFIHNIHP